MMHRNGTTSQLLKVGSRKKISSPPPPSRSSLLLPSRSSTIKNTSPTSHVYTNVYTKPTPSISPSNTKAKTTIEEVSNVIADTDDKDDIPVKKTKTIPIIGNGSPAGAARRSLPNLNINAAPTTPPPNSPHPTTTSPLTKSAALSSFQSLMKKSVTPPQPSILEEEDDSSSAADKRSAVVDAIETVQVISALLAGTGIAFLDNISSPDSSESPDHLISMFKDRWWFVYIPEKIEGVFTLFDSAYVAWPDWEADFTRLAIYSFVSLNLYGLITLSSQLFYLRQILAKDVTMFKPFVLATKDRRYFALKGVLYSMVGLVAVIGLQQFKLRHLSHMARFGGVFFLGLAFYCLRVMGETRRAFSGLRSKSKIKLKKTINAVMAMKKMDFGFENKRHSVPNVDIPPPVVPLNVISVGAATGGSHGGFQPPNSPKNKTMEVLNKKDD